MKPSRKDLTSFTVSALMHIAVVLLVISLEPQLKGQSGNGNADGSKEMAPLDVEVVERQPEEKFQEIPLSYDSDIFGDIPEQPKPEPEEEEDCSGAYGGIGISHSNMMVTEVYRGWPADKGGIQVGDRLETVTGEDVRGEPGTGVYLKITRAGQELYIMLIRENICAFKPKKGSTP